MNNINILFVDDEKFTLHSLDRLLRKESFNTFFAESGSEALEMITQNDIHIIVSDMKMPQMDGLTLLRKIKESNPEIIRLVLSAFTQTVQLLPCINSGEIFRFITKPLEKIELKLALSDAIELHLVQRDHKQLVESLKECNERLQLALQDKKLIENRMETLCGIDELTTLYNRRQLYASLEQELNKYHRYGNIFSGLILDLDLLETTTETHGKSFGDYVLKEFSSRLIATIRKVDLAFRYTDNTFFVILPEATIDQALHTGRRISEICSNNLFEIEKIALPQTVRIGVCTIDKTTSLSPEKFLSTIEKTLNAKEIRIEQKSFRL